MWKVAGDIFSCVLKDHNRVLASGFFINMQHYLGGVAVHARRDNCKSLK